MKLQFKVQQYQTDAVDAVVEVFAGQPKHDGISYRIDPGRLTKAVQPSAMHADGGDISDDAGLRNAEIVLSGAQLLKNVHAMQRSRNLPLSDKLASSAAAPGAPNLDVEMETGTGKTYVYIKTIMELHKRYGWSKYIIVVPSVAIREGVKKSFDVTAEHFQQLYGTKPRSFKRQVKRLDMGANLHDVSNGIEAYKGLFITEVDANRDVLELSNGDVVVAGQLADRDVTEDTKRRIQIREVIRAHLDKERELFTQGIKVLSLFFIDEVAKYRDYSREDTLGDYARVFEEEYVTIRNEILSELPFEETAEYRGYLGRDDVRTVHQGYFSIDRKTKRPINGVISKTGDEKGLSRDTAAYDLILKDKERLLSLAEPVRFIFSHSALREGWDNPNVFVMGILKKSDNTMSRRQEIGRGLRLAVDQHGERMDNPVTVHDINELTVVTDESYTDFVTGLQKEISESLAARPRKSNADYYVDRVLSDPALGVTHKITLDQAKQLQHWLTKHDFVDYHDELTDKWRKRSDLDEIPALPAGLQQFFYQVSELISSLDAAMPAPTDDRKPKKIPLNEANFARKEFQALWARINHKAVYQVQFDSQELIGKCITELDKALTVAPLQYVIQSGKQRDQVEADHLARGTGFQVAKTQTVTETVSAGSQVKYDLLGEITDETKLTRRTAAAILKGVRPDTFAKFRLNPELFITEAARLINEQKATVIIEHLAYDALEDRFDTAIFTENQTAQDFSKTGSKLKKHVYDYVITDSKIEREFVTELDMSHEVAVYAKLPRGFFIPTPVGAYNPDWAIAFTEGSVKHVYFVAETKGSLSTLQLRGVEDAKIECARKFFASLREKNGQDVTYDVVTDYGELMQLVTGHRVEHFPAERASCPVGGVQPDALRAIVVLDDAHAVGEVASSHEKRHLHVQTERSDVHIALPDHSDIVIDREVLGVQHCRRSAEPDRDTGVEERPIM